MSTFRRLSRADRGDRSIFVAETKDRKLEVVRAFDRRTGDELWRAEWRVPSVPFFAVRNGSWIRATPAFDGRHLYVAGMRDVLVCLDAATGAIAWKVDFPQRFETPVPAFGFVCSPLVTDEHVYVQAGGGLSSSTSAPATPCGGRSPTAAGWTARSPRRPSRRSRAASSCSCRRARGSGVSPSSGEVLW